MATKTVYRVSNDHRLPLFWAYSEPWDLHLPEERDLRAYWLDQREAGAQVWTGLAQVVLATVWHADGDYGPDDYDLLLAIDTPRVRAGEPWDVITEATRVRSVCLESLYGWLWQQEGLGELLDAAPRSVALGKIEAWLDEHEGELRAWFEANARKEAVEWYDSIPCPRTATHIGLDGSETGCEYPVEDELVVD